MTFFAAAEEGPAGTPQPKFAATLLIGGFLETATIKQAFPIGRLRAGCIVYARPNAMPYTSLHKDDAGKDVFEVGQQQVNRSNHFVPCLDRAGAVAFDTVRLENDASSGSIAKLLKSQISRSTDRND